MEGYDREFWQFSDQLRLQTAAFSGLSLGDSIWSPAGAAADRRNSQADAAGLFGSPPPADGTLLAAAKNSNISSHLNDGGPGLIGSGKLAFGATTTSKAGRYNNLPNLPADKAAAAAYTTNNNKNINGGYGAKNNNTFSKMGSYGGGYNNSSSGGEVVKSYFNKSAGRPASNNSSNSNGGHGKKQQLGSEYGKKKHAKNEGGGNGAAAADNKRFKTLPASEALPRGEAVGGYIFVCNNDTMDENLRRELFGLPSRYRDSVRAIRPGLPLFLYNYSTHQLHGIFEVTKRSDLRVIHWCSSIDLTSMMVMLVSGGELRRHQHRPDGVGGQEVPRRVALPRTGSCGDAEDPRPAGGGRLPPHPPPLRRAQVPARALRHGGPRAARHLRGQGRRLSNNRRGQAGTTQ